MREATKRAQGYTMKGGVTRQIALRVDEATFFRIKKMAIKEGRSFNNMVGRLLEAAIAWPPTESK